MANAEIEKVELLQEKKHDAIIDVSTIEPVKEKAKEKERPVRTRSPVQRKAKTEAANAVAAAKLKQPLNIEVIKTKKRPSKENKKPPTESGETDASHFDLIVEALAQSKERSGSSRQAIAKYVSSKKANYASHLLNKALRSGVEKEKFVQNKGFYKLSPALKKKATSTSNENKKQKTVKSQPKEVVTTKKVLIKKAPSKKAVKTAKPKVTLSKDSKKVKKSKAAIKKTGKKASA